VQAPPEARAAISESSRARTNTCQLFADDPHKVVSCVSLAASTDINSRSIGLFKVGHPKLRKSPLIPVLTECRFTARRQLTISGTPGLAGPNPANTAIGRRRFDTVSRVVDGNSQIWIGKRRNKICEFGLVRVGRQSFFVTPCCSIGIFPRRGQLPLHFAISQVWRPTDQRLRPTKQQRNDRPNTQTREPTK